MLSKRILGDIRAARWLYIKAILLLSTGTLASVLILIESPRVRTALLLAVAVWAFCRAYYFAFYVVQQYADPVYRFSGLVGFARYCWARRSGVRPNGGGSGPDQGEDGM